MRELIMTIPRSITSPKAFLIAKGLLDNLETHIKPIGQNALIICDTFFIERINHNIKQHFSKAHITAHLENLQVNAPKKKSNA